MKKTILIIVVNIIIICSILLFMNVSNKNIHEFPRGNTIENRDIQINVGEEVRVEETFSIKMESKSKRIKVREIYKFFDNIGNVEELEIEGKNIISSFNDYEKFEIYNNSTNIINKNIKVKYELNKKDIKKYTDLAQIKILLCPDWAKYVKNINIDINFENNNEMLKANIPKTFKKVETTKLSDTQFKIYIDRTSEKELNMLFNSPSIQIGEIQNITFAEMETEIANNYIEDKQLNIYLIASIFMTIVIYAMYFIVKNKKINSNRIKNDWEDLVPPVLAETIIDGKMGIKEFLMTIITDLITRGNITVINDEIIELKNKENLKTYELKTIELIFQQKQRMKFSDLKEIFKTDNEKTTKIKDKIKEIKLSILSELEEKNLLDRNKKTIMYIAKVISFINIFIVFLTFVGITGETDSTMLLSIILIVIYIISTIKQDKNVLVRKMFNKKIQIFMFLQTAIVILLLSENIFKMPIQYTISFFVILLLNIVFNRIIPTYYLSLQGEKERLKIQEFKNYLEKYSIIEERKLEEIVIWDKYLVYAIALGITNKIPKKYMKHI